MVYCQQCGGENVDDARFCVHCGSRIQKVQREQPRPAPEPEPQPEPQREPAPRQKPEQRRTPPQRDAGKPARRPSPLFGWLSNRKTIAIIVVAVAVAAVAVGLLLANPFGDGSGDGLPEVAVEAPGNGAIVKDTVTVSGTADASDGEIAKVQVRIGSEGGWIVADGTTSWSYDWDTSARQDGRVAISARSYDGSNYSRVATMVYDVNNVGDVVEMSVQEFFTALGAMVDGQNMTWQSSIVGVAPNDILQVSGTVSQLVYHNESEFPEIGEYTTVSLSYNETVVLPVHVIGNLTHVVENEEVLVSLHVFNVSGSFPDMTNSTWQLSGEFFQEQFIFGIFAFDSARSNLIVAPDQVAKA